MVDLLGMRQTEMVMTGIIARQTFATQANTMRKFWDISSKRAQALEFHGQTIAGRQTPISLTPSACFAISSAHF